MSKKITIESMSPEQYLDINEILIESNSRCWTEGNKVYLEIDETDKEEMISIMLNISVILILNYVPYTKLCKTEAQKNFVLSHLFKDSDFRNALLIDLLSYFESNSILKENAYFLFNMNGFKADIQALLEMLKSQEAYQKQLNEAREVLKKKGLKFADLKTLHLIEVDDGFGFRTNSGMIITPESLKKDYGISFQVSHDPNSELFLPAFTGLICAIFGTKRLNVDSVFYDMCDYLVEAFMSLNCDVDIHIVY